jgi:hypothetical protein
LMARMALLPSEARVHFLPSFFSCVLVVIVQCCGCVVGIFIIVVCVSVVVRE